MADPEVDRLPEEDHPPNAVIAIGVAATTIFVVGATVALLVGFRVYGDWERARKAGIDETLRATVAASRAELDEYAVVDYEGDRFRVPVARAMEQLVRDPSLIAPQGPQVGQPTELAPAGGAAAGDAANAGDTAAVADSGDEAMGADEAAEGGGTP